MKNELRTSLWYGKYEYRAKFNLQGCGLSHGSKTFTSYLKHLERTVVGSLTGYPWGTAPIPSALLKAINLDSMERWFNWKRANLFAKNILIRMELNNLSVFSNDLSLLKTLELIEPESPVTYTKAIPTVIKYFAREPKHKYRLYLTGCRLAENSTFVVDLNDCINRYKSTNTVMTPSDSLGKWLTLKSWKSRYCSKHYYIDYNEPSTYTLLYLLFDSMIATTYKLEKVPLGINTP